MKREDGKYAFASHFDPATGFYCRTGVLDENGHDTGVDPFMAEFPELLDIGVMGHCAHGLSGECARAGIQCYQSGATVHQDNMALDDFRWIVDQSRGRVFQFALGGRGDPELHSDFEEMLAYSRDNGIVPNLTTSGFLLDGKRAALIAKYCGAAAVSWYRTEHTLRAIDLLLQAGVRTNIHFLLGGDTVDEAIGLLQGDGLPQGVNRVVFLLFKPVGQGRQDNVLVPDDSRVATFFRLMDTDRGLRIAGFDSCSVPAIINHTSVIDRNAFDTCEGARFSAYITPDMKLLPCSFDQEMRWAFDLRAGGASIAEGWESPGFEDFRSRLRDACPHCAQRSLCMGGCPIRPEIVLCKNRHEYRACRESA
ncbi:MAG: radical SAM protein [Bacillota bacterium]|nr:radical SAM protein [Bacillota bacterium]